MGKKKNLSPAARKRILDGMPLGVRLLISILFLICALIYTFWPIDFLPDILGPIGWTDDIGVWLLAIIADSRILLKSSWDRGKDSVNEKKQKDGFFEGDV